MSIQCIRYESTKTSHDGGFHEHEIATGGPVLPDGSNLGMAKAVEKRVVAHRVTVAKVYELQMFHILQAAVYLLSIHPATREQTKTRENRRKCTPKFSA